VFREAVPVAFWEAVSMAVERSSARIVSRIIAVWDVTTYVGIDAHNKEPTERRASCGRARVTAADDDVAD
jgi:hypothetical protein